MLQRILIIVLLTLSTENVFSQDERSMHPYKYQVSLELGLGDNSAPGTSFPFGGSISGNFRLNNHVLGLRTSTFSDLNIFGSSTYYNLTGPFYGYAFQSKNANFIPQVSLGFFRTNYKQAIEYTGVGLELSASANLHYRGLGIGVRPLVNINPIETYAGFVFHLLLGWEWNSRTK